MRRHALNPPDLRPDRAPRPPADARPGQPRVGMVSLGCPKALVDSERILTRLRADGYAISPDYAGADVVIVNTCGFLDSAKAESLEAIGEALAENGRVIVTGCLGADEDYIRGAHPSVLAVTGPHQYEAVVDAVHAAVPPAPDPFVDLLPAAAVHLTPRHYSYLKISEGCNHKCRFCIIPDMRGHLVSRPAHAVLREAEKLVAAGVRELLVISQDTSAYGVDRRHDATRGRTARSARHITDLARELGALGAWVRLHYVYPYPHVRDLIPLMAEGLVLPYLDIPFQHATRTCSAAWPARPPRRRPSTRSPAGAPICPDITLRSTFIVGFPGETEAEFQHLLDWLDEAQLDRVGAFKYETVAGARANALPDHVPEAVKEERWDRFMAKAQRDQRRQARGQGRHPHSRSSSTRSTTRPPPAAPRPTRPEIDGNLYIDEDFEAPDARRHRHRRGRGGRRLRPLGQPRLSRPNPQSRADDRPRAIGSEAFSAAPPVDRVCSPPRLRACPHRQEAAYRIVIPIRLFTARDAAIAAGTSSAPVRPHRHQFVAAGPERARLRARATTCTTVCADLDAAGAALGRGIAKASRTGTPRRRLPVHRATGLGALLGGVLAHSPGASGHPQLAQRRELVSSSLAS